MTTPRTTTTPDALAFHLMDDEVPTSVAVRRRLLSVLNQLCLVGVTLFLLVPAGIFGLILELFSNRAKVAVGSRALHYAARLMLWFFGWRVEVRGTPPVRDGERGILIAANHLCYMDVLTLGSQFPIRFLGKNEIATWPLVGPIATSLGIIFLKRFDRSHIVKTKAVIEKGLKRGESIALFPEATTGDGRRVLPFHAPLLDAARATGAIVVPAAIHYAAPADSRPAHEVLAWWRPTHLFAHLPRLLSVRPVVATLTWGEVIDPLKLAAESKAENESAIEREVRRGIAQKARQSVAEGLAGVTDYGAAELLRRGDLPEWAPGADRTTLESEA